jgi:hypothetical protein
LDNTRAGNVAKEYLNKMEKEVGKKVSKTLCFFGVVSLFCHPSF